MLHGLVQSQNICSKSEGMGAAAGLEMRVVVSGTVADILGQSKTKPNLQGVHVVLRLLKCRCKKKYIGGGGGLVLVEV